MHYTVFYLPVDNFFVFYSFRTFYYQDLKKPDNESGYMIMNERMRQKNIKRTSNQAVVFIRLHCYQVIQFLHGSLLDLAKPWPFTANKRTVTE